MKSLIFEIKARFNYLSNEFCKRDFVILVLGTILISSALASPTNFLLWGFFFVWIVICLHIKKYSLLLVFLLVATLQMQLTVIPAFEPFTDFKAELGLRAKVLLPQEHASLFVGMLVGSRESFSKDFKSALTASGTLHLVAISGANVAVFAGIIKASLQKLPRKLTQISSVLVILLFLLVVGITNVPALRACLSFFYATLALALGRKVDNLSALSLIAILVNTIQPLAYLTLSFQLTFAVSLAIVVFAKQVRGRIAFLGKFWSENLSIIIVANLATIPILSLIFDEVQLYAIPVNLLLVPIVEIIFIEAVVYWPLLFLVPKFAEALAPLVWLPLEILIRIVKWSSSLPNSQLSLTETWQYGIIILIVSIVCGLLFESKYRNQREWLKS